MTRMIERWFPCAEVSANSPSGWGSGNQERNLFTWFAARPTAQAKAAVVCSLLEWPDDELEQKRLQDLVSTAMTGRYAAWDELHSAILASNPTGVSILDPTFMRNMSVSRDVCFETRAGTPQTTGSARTRTATGGYTPGRTLFG
jgi:putative DNA methylase